MPTKNLGFDESSKIHVHSLVKVKQRILKWSVILKRRKIKYLSGLLIKIFIWDKQDIGEIQSDAAWYFTQIAGLYFFLLAFVQTTYW